MNQAFIALLIFVVAGCVHVLVSLDEEGREEYQAKSSALMVGIVLGLLAAGALDVISEIASAPELQPLELPLGLLVCAEEYIRRMWRFESKHPEKDGL